MLKNKINFLLLFCLFVSSHTAANFYPLCEDIQKIEIGNYNSSSEYKRLLNASALSFKEYYFLAQSEIEKSIYCIQTDDTSNDCESRKNYFFDVLPKQLRDYRANLALSDYSTEYSYFSSKKPEYPFNIELQGPEIFWYKTQDVKPLTEDEAKTINIYFNKKWTVIVRKVLSQMELVKSKYEADQYGVAGRLFFDQYELLSRGSFSDVYILNKKNDLIRSLIWTKKAIEQFENTVQKLSKKRIIYQLSMHPILYFLKENFINKDNVLVALLEMKLNIQNNKIKTSKMLDDLFMRGATAHPRRNASFRWKDFSFVGENFLVANSVLEADRSLCGIVEFIAGKNALNNHLKTAAIVTTGIALFMLTSPVLAVTGVSILHAFTLFESHEKLSAISEKAFLNPQAELNQYDSADVYMSLNDFGTNILVTPVILAGIPMMKLQNIIKYLK